MVVHGAIVQQFLADGRLTLTLTCAFTGLFPSLQGPEAGPPHSGGAGAEARDHTSAAAHPVSCTCCMAAAGCRLAQQRPIFAMLRL